jgi:hypothetical protein
MSLRRESQTSDFEGGFAPVEEEVAVRNKGYSSEDLANRSRFRERTREIANAKSGSIFHSTD